MCKITLIVLLLISLDINALHGQKEYSRKEVINILSDNIRIHKKENILWRKAQKDTLLLKDYKEYCLLDSLNLIDEKYKLHKVYNDAARYIINYSDSTIMQLYFNLLSESENSADEHLRYVTGKIIVQKPEMIFTMFNKQEKKKKKIIYIELLRGLEDIKYHKPDEVKYQKAKNMLNKINPNK